MKRLNLHPEILRFLISRAEELPELVSRKEREEKAMAAKAVRREAPTPVETKTADAKEDTRQEKPSRPSKEAKEVEDIDKQLEEILNI